MTEISIDPRVFNDIYRPHLVNYARTQLFFGGSGSGKSVFLAQRAVTDIMKGGRNYLICRAVARTIRRSVYNEIEKVISKWGVSHLFNSNKSEMVITCKNGYQILFTGLDDTEKVKSITPKKGVITDIWIEEATETDHQSVKELYKRQRGGRADVPKRMTLSFNPILQSHWIYTEYFNPVAWADDQTEYNGDDLSILKTWYVHNEFLTEDDIKDLLNEKDEYYRSVYTFGNWGVLGNVIFTNWRTEDLSDMYNQFTSMRFGLDFGFSQDPAALICTHYDKRTETIYIFDELYERGLTNHMLATEIKSIISSGYITCDSAEPKSIAELQGYGINAIPAAKGRDSVIHGVQWLQQKNIVIDKRCVNVRNEFQQYKWREDKNGNALRQPLDANNHAIDALRYAYEQDMIGVGDLFVFGI
jgi:phage terminase large subunit